MSSAGLVSARHDPASADMERITAAAEGRKTPEEMADFPPLLQAVTEWYEVRNGAERSRGEDTQVFSDNFC